MQGIGAFRMRETVAGRRHCGFPANGTAHSGICRVPGIPRAAGIISYKNVRQCAGRLYIPRQMAR